MIRKTLWSGYSFAWITLALFLLSLSGHWIAGWFAFVDEQHEHHQTAELTAYCIVALRDTLENWQSEFLQLLWQVGGLSFLYYLGSPQSKEGDERKEEKLDRILRAVLKKEEADAAIRDIDGRFPRH